MKFSIGESINHPFKDKYFTNKVAVLIAILFIPTAIALLGNKNISFLFNFPVYIFYSGFIAIYGFNIINNKEEILPDFNYKKFFIDGLKFNVVSICYTLTIIVLYFLLIIPLAIIGVIANALQIFLLLPALFIIGGIIIFLAFIYLSVLIFSFCETLTLSKAISIENMKKALKIIKSEFLSLSILLLLLFVYTIASSIIVPKEAVLNPISSYSIIMTLLTPFLGLIYNSIIAHIYKCGLSKLEHVESSDEVIMY